MDKMVKKPISILNLAGELSSELINYFAQKEIQVAEASDLNPEHQLTHILTKDVHDFTEILSTYDVFDKEIKLISLSAVDDLQHFMNSQGKLILHDLWMQTKLGPFILDKFLQEYGGLALNENYPTFQEKGSFNITNPFNTGEYLDRLVQSAFTDGVSGLAIKTFFDHLVMYLTALKTKGKVGMPIEVSYGYFEDVFGVQLNFYTKDIILEDITASLSTEISKKADRYLLNVAVQSSDFFDFTLLKEVNKTVITGLWTKDDRIQAENKGFLFNELSARAAVTNYPTEGVTSFQLDASPIEDFSDKIVLSGSPQEKEVSQTISGGMPEEEFSQVLKGSPDEVDNFSQVISGTKAEEDIINIVKGSIQEEEKVFRLSGGEKFDVDKFAFKVSSDLSENDKKDDVFKIKSLKSELPEAIKSSFHVFASGLNKSIEDISHHDLQVFREQEIPKIIKMTTKRLDAQAPSTPVVDKSRDLKAATLASENEVLKSKIKTLMTEVKILKESKAQMNDLHNKARAAAEAGINSVPVASADDALKAQMMQKMMDQKILSEQDTVKLASLMERENKVLAVAKEAEMNLKKLQIEMIQKESIFGQEMEKLNRSVKSKDLILLKTKEGLTKISEQKDDEIRLLQEKLATASKALSSNQSQNQANQIRELERKVINHEKMIEIYKTKMAEKPAVKVEDEVAKEENRKLQMMNIQIKNQLEMSKKEALKLQERSVQDAAAYASLKTEKANLDALLKKAMLDAKKDESAVANIQHQEQEFKRLKGQFELLEVQLKDGQHRQRDLESKLQDALKNQKKDVVSEDTNSKGKMAHLENNVRKLTQDLGDSKNQLAEMKKETNKLRQEKIALQNQIDKMKKEADKGKPAAPKKPGMGGKAA